MTASKSETCELFLLTSATATAFSQVPFLCFSAHSSSRPKTMEENGATSRGELGRKGATVSV